MFPYFMEYIIELFSSSAHKWIIQYIIFKENTVFTFPNFILRSKYFVDILKAETMLNLYSVSQQMVFTNVLGRLRKTILWTDQHIRYIAAMLLPN
jgi:hypothetical protein